MLAPFDRVWPRVLVIRLPLSALIRCLFGQKLYLFYDAPWAEPHLECEPFVSDPQWLVEHGYSEIEGS
jgi:hypothetical protein